MAGAVEYWEVEVALEGSSSTSVICVEAHSEQEARSEAVGRHGRIPRFIRVEPVATAPLAFELPAGWP